MPLPPPPRLAPPLSRAGPAPATPSSSSPPPLRLRLPWPAMLSQEEVLRGLGYYGSGERLRAVAAKLLAGRPIKVCVCGVLGGWIGEAPPIRQPLCMPCLAC